MSFFRVREKIDDEEVKEAYKRMHEQIQEKGEKLHFLMKVDKEGWFAICQEFPSIVTGGSDKNPSREEVFRSIIDSIKTAFHLPIAPLKMVDEKPQVRVELKEEFYFPNYL